MGVLGASQLCWNWVPCLKGTVSGGYDILMVPKDTVLFHGTSTTDRKMVDYSQNPDRRYVLKAIGDADIPTVPAYFGALKTASWYAFANDVRRGEEGKVISVRTDRDVAVLAITRNNLDRLIAAFPRKAPVDAIAFAFPIGAVNRAGKHFDRVSDGYEDKVVTKWLCSVIPKLGHRLQGWAFPNPRGFHDELVLCSKRGVQRFPLEVRFASSGAPGDLVFVTWRGRIVDITDSASDLGWTGPRAILYNEFRYEPVKGRTSDAFMFEPAWLDRAEAIASGAAPRPPYFIDLAALVGARDEPPLPPKPPMGFNVVRLNPPPPRASPAPPAPRRAPAPAVPVPVNNVPLDFNARRNISAPKPAAAPASGRKIRFAASPIKAVRAGPPKKRYPASRTKRTLPAKTKEWNALYAVE